MDTDSEFRELATSAALYSLSMKKTLSLIQFGLIYYKQCIFICFFMVWGHPISENAGVDIKNH